MGFASTPVCRLARLGALAALAACAIAGCSRGGQSSDDGAPRDRDRDRDRGEDAGMTAPDGGMGELTIVVRAVLDGDFTVGCGAGFDEALLEQDRAAAVLAAPERCEGAEGRFLCSCEGQELTSYATSCVGALLEACGARAEPIGGPAELPADCSSRLPGRAGRCEPAGAGYACRCGADEAGAPARKVERPGISCERALFEACAQPCADAYGECAAVPGADERAGHYACTCATNGLTLSVGGPGCDQALGVGCNPANILDQGCSGYGGYCETGDPEQTSARCTCADGSEHEVAHAPYWLEPREHACRETLEATCGLGDPPEGALCMESGNGHSARCTRAPASDAPLHCECGLGTESLLSIRYEGPFTDVACETALHTSCPEILPIDDGDRASVCDFYAECETPAGFDRETCESSVSDACVACTRAERVRRGDGEDCPAHGVACNEVCRTLVPEEIAIAACEDALRERDALTDGGRCLCSACHPAFGECMADDGCFELFACAVAQGCEMETCLTDPVCGPLIMAAYSTRSLGLLVNVSACPHRDACRDP